MSELLFIDANVRPAGVSRTRKLAESFLAAFAAAHPETKITRLELAKMSLQPHSQQKLEHRDALLAAGKSDDAMFALARQFAAAQRIVVAAPFWDLCFPAALKLYIENISVYGITFGFDGNRMYGLCRCKSLAYLTTRGGVFTGADADMDIALPYMRALVKMFGLGELVSVAAEGLDIDGADVAEIMAAAEKEAREIAETF